MFALLLGTSVAYVSVLGSDKNPGTADAPWRTLQYACDHVALGGRVLVRGGIYRERVAITRSVSLLAAPGESPAIDGAGLDVPDGVTALVLVKNADGVTVSGFELRGFRTTNASRVPAGLFVEGKADGVTLSSNLIHDIANTGKDKGSINAFGIAVYGDSKAGAITNLTVRGNEIRDTKTGNSETLAVNGNVDGFRVLDNRIHDVDNIGIVAIGFEGTSPLKGKDQARNGLIAGNRIENATSAKNPAYGGERSADGIYVDGGTGIVIERNAVRGADLGIEVASEHKGKLSSNVVVRSNLVTLSNVCGISIGGYDAGRGGTSGCTIANNTLVGNDATGSGTGEIQVQYNTDGNAFANNVVVASAQGVLLTTVTGKGSKVGIASDHNLFDAPGAATWVWKGKSYASLESFSSGAGLDTHSLYGQPGFVGPSGGDYRLGSGSVGIDAGAPLDAKTLGSLDLLGAARVQGRAVDLGCYESTKV